MLTRFHDRLRWQLRLHRAVVKLVVRLRRGREA